MSRCREAPERRRCARPGCTETFVSRAYGQGARRRYCREKCAQIVQRSHRDLVKSGGR